MWTLLLLSGAVFTDFNSRRITNRMVCLGIFTGLSFQLIELGIQGFLFGILRVFFPVIVLYLLFLMRALGAGDIKLFSVIGSMWSFQVLVWCMVFSFLTGAGMSLCKLLYHRSLLSRLSYFRQYIQRVICTKTLPVYDEPSSEKQNFIHFSIAILIGYFITMGVVH